MHAHLIRWPLLAVFLALAPLAAGQTPPPCQPEWIPTFGSLPPHLEAMAVALDEARAAVGASPAR